MITMKAGPGKPHLYADTEEVKTGGLLELMANQPSPPGKFPPVRDPASKK